MTLLLAALAVGAGCSPGRAEQGTKADGLSCGAWIVYWDWESGVEEAEALTPLPDRLIAFGALFDTDRRVILEPEAEDMLRAMQKKFPAERVYLSVINDLTLAGGGYANKDVALLRELMLDAGRRSAHVRELVALAEEWQLKGLEIDYENIHYDAALWEGYTAFLRELYGELYTRGIRMRVCLEWDSLLYTTLPEGPEYVIMCYSLYGYHSGPGPKADPDFLKKVAALYGARTDCVMALATGGYDWKGQQVERELKEREAEKLFRSGNLKTVRDESSGVLTGQYRKDGSTHTVWYADAETLRGWMEVLREAGFSRFDFFRLGGNRVADWNALGLSGAGGEHEEGGVTP